MPTKRNPALAAQKRVLEVLISTLRALQCSRDEGIESAAAALQIELEAKLSTYSTANGLASGQKRTASPQHISGLQDAES